MPRLTHLRCRRLPRWLVAGVCAGGIGCSALTYQYHSYPTSPEHLLPPAATRKIQQAEPKAELIPTSATMQQAAPATLPTPTAEQNIAPKEIPITLDVVLRLAEQHNPRIAAARERLRESEMTLQQGLTGWMPNVYAGIAYYRHEGGIQQFDGSLLHSSFGALYPGLQISSDLDLREGVFQLIELERRIWQNRADLSQINNEVLMEAGLTYIDLLSARRGEKLIREIEKYEERLLDRVEKLAKTEPGFAAMTKSIRASLINHHQMASRLRQKANAASAKLVYLLGLPPGTCLHPIDHLTPIELVDTSAPPCDLIAKSFTNGPGVQEMQAILDTVARTLEKTYGPYNYLPTVQANISEGLFGAGPGASLAWDNRFDFGLQVRWNLTNLSQTEAKRNVIRSKQAQAMYNYDEVRNKLALGVTEARDTIFAGREQIGLATSQIVQAGESYELSQKRMEANLSASGPSEVLLAIRNMEQAHFNHLQAIQEHNKAQIRLMMLLGGGPATAAEAKPVATAPVTLPTLPEPLQNSPDKQADKNEEQLPKLLRPANDS